MLFICSSRTSLILAALFVGGLPIAVCAQVPSPDYFPIGVHGQPKSSFDKWQSRGGNTLFQYKGENNSLGVPTASMKLWSDTAASKGLFYVPAPSPNPPRDLQARNLLAW